MEISLYMNQRCIGLSPHCEKDVIVCSLHLQSFARNINKHVTGIKFMVKCGVNLIIDEGINDYLRRVAGVIKKVGTENKTNNVPGRALP